MVWDCRMAQVLIFSDALGAAHADDLGSQLRRLGLDVDRYEKPQFPIADAMPRTLGGLSGRAELCLAVISEHTNAIHWIARELSMANLYPNWLIAFAPGVTVPEVFRAGGPRVILPGDDPLAHIARMLGSGRGALQ
jgi:hypothetical protein